MHLVYICCIDRTRQDTEYWLIHALRNNYIDIYCRLIMDKRLGKVYTKANMAYKVLYLHFPGMTKEKKGNPQSR
jgi:hypothetical protein